MRIDAAALGLDEKFQLAAAGVHLALVFTDEAVEQRLRRELCDLCLVLRAFSFAERLHVGGGALRQQRTLEQRKLARTVGDHVVQNVVEQQQICHVRIAGRVVAGLRVADEVVGEAVLRLAHHRGPLVEHFAAVGDHSLLHVAEALGHGAHQLGIGVEDIDGLFVVALAGGDGGRLALAQLVEIFREQRLKQHEHLVAPRGVHRLHHSGDLFDLSRTAVILRQHIEIGLQGGELFVQLTNRRGALLAADGRFPDLVDALCDVVLALCLAHLIVLHFKRRKLVERLQLVGAAYIKDIHRLPRAQVVGEFVGLCVVLKVQRFDLLIRDRRTGGRDVRERGGG